MENNQPVTTKKSANEVLGYVNTGLAIAGGAVGLAVGVANLVMIIRSARAEKKARKAAEEVQAHEE